MPFVGDFWVPECVWYLQCITCKTRWNDMTAIPVAGYGPGCCRSPAIHVMSYYAGKPPR